MDSVKWNRRTPQSKRKITPRSISLSSSTTVGKKNPFRNYSPKKQSLKKNDFLPKDPNASIIRQLSEVVKKSASYILKSIGISQKELRPFLENAYRTFFVSFDKWMKETKMSFRKANEKEPYLNLLKARLEESEGKMIPLMNESRKWKKVKPKTIQVNIPVLKELEKIDYKSDPDQYSETIDDIINYLDEISIFNQNKKAKLCEIRDICEQIGEELRTTIEVNFQKQLNLCLQLTPISCI